MIGDFNSRVDNKEYDVVGMFGEDALNENGKRSIDVCREFSYVVANTYYQHKDIHKYRWIDPGRNLKSMIDLFLIKGNCRKLIKDIRVFTQTECASNHHLVIGKFIFPYKNDAT